MKPRTLVLFALISIVIPILVWGWRESYNRRLYAFSDLPALAGRRPASPAQHEPVDPLSQV